MPSQNIGVYDIDSLFVIFGARRIVGWPDSGTIFSATKLAPEEVEGIEGVDGEIALIKKKGRLYRAEITVAGSAIVNNYLWNLLQTQRNTPGIPLLNFVISHTETKMVSAQACLIGHPPMEYGADSLPTKTWPFLLTNFDGVMTGLSVDGPAATLIT